METKSIKVLIVDDSPFMRTLLRDILESQPEITVAGTAKNGVEAISKTKELQPDIVTLDVEMPEMNGIEALRIIMKENPLPVIMLSSYTREGADITLRALELGAVDYIFKPSQLVDMDIQSLKESLITKIIGLKNSNILRTENLIYRKSPEITFTESILNNIQCIIGVGASTGGPSALKQFLISFPKNIPASILIVQHMPPNFTSSLARRLDSLCEINVKEGQKGEIMKPGCAYIAPGDYHMIVYEQGSNYRINLNTNEPVYGHRPSVDVLMNSICKLNLENKVGVIMTGMGRDGSVGLKKLKDKNGYIIAQNEETCVVYGMPKAAIEIGAVDKVLPLQEISYEILNYIQRLSM